VRTRTLLPTKKLQKIHYIVACLCSQSFVTFSKTHSWIHMLCGSQKILNCLYMANSANIICLSAQEYTLVHFLLEFLCSWHFPCSTQTSSRIMFLEQTSFWHAVIKKQADNSAPCTVMESRSYRVSLV